MRHVLGSRTELKHRKKLGARIDGEPEPHHLLVAPEPGSQFIQLEMRELEMAEEALVQGLCMFPRASEPGGDGRLSVAKDSCGRGRVQSFGECRQHDCNLLGRGFQPVQGRVTSSTEGGAASLTTERLDALR